MKNVLFMLFMAVMAIGCKNDKDINPVSSKVITCEEKIKETIAGMAASGSTTIYSKDIAELLKSCGDIVCQDEGLIKQIEGIHKIDDNTYNSMLKNFWGNDVVLYNKFSWDSIMKNHDSTCYQNYISFHYSEKKIDDISLKTINDFSEDFTCYSIPLFKSIQKNHSTINKNSIVKFTKAKDKNNNVIIVFEVDSSNTKIGFYDISQIPLSNPKLIKFIKDLKTKL